MDIIRNTNDDYFYRESFSVRIKILFRRDVILCTMYTISSRVNQRERKKSHPVSITINAMYPRISIVVERCFHINKHKPVENYRLPINNIEPSPPIHLRVSSHRSSNTLLHLKIKQKKNKQLIPRSRESTKRPHRAYRA